MVNRQHRERWSSDSECPTVCVRERPRVLYVFGVSFGIINCCEFFLFHAAEVPPIGPFVVFLQPVLRFLKNIIFTPGM